MSKAVLTFAISEAGKDQRRIRIAEDIVKLGKDPKSHLHLDGEGAARMHAVIEVAGPGDVTLIDLGNEPGTVVNGVRVNKCKLHLGDRIDVGDTSLVLEGAEAPAAFNAGSAADPLSRFRAPPAVAAAVLAGDLMERGVFGSGLSYTLLKSGPAVRPEEVELSNVQAAEVTITWGGNVLYVTHLTPPRDFFVGEEQSKGSSSDFFIPSEKLGTTRLPVLLVEQGTTYAVIPAEAQGSVELPGRGVLSLDQARQSGELCAAHSGAHKIALPAGAKARIELAGFAFHVSSVAAGKPVPHGLAAGLDRSAVAYFGLSALVHASLISALAFFVPSLGDLGDEELERSRTDVLMQYLRASAERNQEQTQDNSAETPSEREGGTGERSRGAEGAAGTPLTRAVNKRWAVAGPKDNPEPYLPRERARSEAETFGMIGLLASGVAGDPKVPTAPWGRDLALGRDDVSAMGQMFGVEIGEAFGAGGFGLSGYEQGGGGYGDQIGLGDIGFGHGAGLGTREGFGNGHGQLMRGHKTKVPRVGMDGRTTVSGRLPPEVIQRIVRQNFGRFRMCYTQGLTRNPNLEGRVSARFVIGRDGAVSNVSNGGSDIPDSGVVSCVLSAFYGLSFPEPENGIVTVVYPILLSPG